MTLSQNLATMLKKILEVVASISEMGIMRFGPEGMFLQTMDLSHICLVEIKLPPDWFESYMCKDLSLIHI